MVNELAARSINEVETKNGQIPDSPVTPVSPNKRKFSFRFPTPVTSHTSRTERKTFSDEAACIPDLQVNCVLFLLHLFFDEFTFLLSVLVIIYSWKNIVVEVCESVGRIFLSQKFSR